MKGTLLKTENGWIVEYWVGLKVFEYPLHPDFTQYLKEPEFHNLSGKDVEFEIMDEFTHPEHYEGIPLFEGIKYAKLKL